MLNKKKLATAAAASFGAAMASIHCAPELQADILDLSFSPGSVAFNPGPTTFASTVFVDQVGVPFLQFNDSIGQTLVGGVAGTTGFLEGIRLVSFSQSLAAATFPGVGSGGTALPAFGSGTAYFGFHFQGNVGWFSANLGDGTFTPTITYLEGEYGSAGETVRVGGTIPEPTAFGALAALALGATSIRRRRKLTSK